MARRQPQDLTTERHWYVYALIDPRTGWPFYVGKGCRRRAWQHESAATRGTATNPWKARRIRAILAAGVRPEVHILARFADEAVAYRCERATIRSIAGLTNISPGGSPAECALERSRRDAQDRLRRLVPFDAWLAAAPRSALEQKCYWRVVAELRRLAIDGWVDRKTFLQRIPARAAA
jgi:hypothetical protein